MNYSHIIVLDNHVIIKNIQQFDMVFKEADENPKTRIVKLCKEKITNMAGNIP